MLFPVELRRDGAPERTRTPVPRLEGAGLSGWLTEAIGGVSRILTGLGRFAGGYIGTLSSRRNWLRK